MVKGSKVFRFAVILSALIWFCSLGAAEAMANVTATPSTVDSGMVVNITADANASLNSLPEISIYPSSMDVSDTVYYSGRNVTMNNASEGLYYTEFTGLDGSRNYNVQIFSNSSDKGVKVEDSTNLFTVNMRDISTCQELQSLNQYPQVEAELVNDINCTESRTWNGGSGFDPLEHNGGAIGLGLEGNNNVIYNLYINRSGGNIGLIGELGPISAVVDGQSRFGTAPNSYVRNLAVFNTTIVGGGDEAGILVGQADNGESLAASRRGFDSLATTGKLEGGEYVGGIIGRVLSTNLLDGISNTYSRANVTGDDAVGGLVGCTDTSDLGIEDSYFSGFINEDSGTAQPLVDNYTTFSSQCVQTPQFSDAYWNVDETGISTSDYSESGVTGLTSSGLRSLSLSGYSTGIRNDKYPYINPHPPNPFANYTEMNTSLVLGESLTSTVTSEFQTSRQDVEWRLGNGDTSTSTSLDYTYPSQGKYRVTLFERDGNSWWDTKSEPVEVYGSLTASISGDDYTIPYRDKNFDASGSTGNIENYEWEFGDGSTATGEQVTHQFNSTGTFTVELNVSNPYYHDTTTFTVEVDKIESSFDYSPDHTVVTESVQFTDKSIDPDGDISSYSWGFDDGGAASSEDASNTFSTPGEYNVTHNITLSNGTVYTSFQLLDVVSWKNLQDNTSGVAFKGETTNLSVEFNPLSKGLDRTVLATNESGSFQNFTSTVKTPMFQDSSDSIMVENLFQDFFDSQKTVQVDQNSRFQDFTINTSTNNTELHKVDSYEEVAIDMTGSLDNNSIWKLEASNVFTEYSVKLYSKDLQYQGKEINIPDSILPNDNAGKEFFSIETREDNDRYYFLSGYADDDTDQLEVYEFYSNWTLKGLHTSYNESEGRLYSSLEWNPLKEKWVSIEISEGNSVIEYDNTSFTRYSSGAEGQPVDLEYKEDRDKYAITGTAYNNLGYFNTDWTSAGETYEGDWPDGKNDVSVEWNTQQGQGISLYYNPEINNWYVSTYDYDYDSQEIIDEQVRSYIGDTPDNTTVSVGDQYVFNYSYLRDTGQDTSEVYNADYNSTSGEFYGFNVHNYPSAISRGSEKIYVGGENDSNGGCINYIQFYYDNFSRTGDNSGCILEQVGLTDSGWRVGASAAESPQSANLWVMPYLAEGFSDTNGYYPTYSMAYKFDENASNPHNWSYTGSSINLTDVAGIKEPVGAYSASDGVYIYDRNSSVVHKFGKDMSYTGLGINLTEYFLKVEKDDSFSARIGYAGSGLTRLQDGSWVMLDSPAEYADLGEPADYKVFRADWQELEGQVDQTHSTVFARPEHNQYFAYGNPAFDILSNDYEGVNEVNVTSEANTVLENCENSFQYACDVDINVSGQNTGLANVVLDTVEQLTFSQYYSSNFFINSVDEFFQSYFVWDNDVFEGLLGYKVFALYDDGSVESTNVEELAVDSQAPYWRNLNQNITSPILKTDPVEMSAEWYDEYSGVDTVYLATNETGSWKNKTSYGSPVSVGSGADTWESVSFVWGNSSVGNSYVCWRQWANDSVGGNWNSTDVTCFQTYEVFSEDQNQSLNVVANVSGSYGASDSGSSTVTVVDSGADTVDVSESLLQSGSVVSGFSRSLNVFVDAIGGVSVSGVVAEFKQVFVGFGDVFSVLSQGSEDTLPSAIEIRTFDQEFNQQSRFQSNEDLLVRFDASHTEGRDFLDTAEVTLVRPDGTSVVENASMTEVGNISKGKTYAYNHSLGSGSQSSGEWSVEVDVNDTDGDVDSMSNNIIVQIVSVLSPEPDQDSVNIFSDVPFTTQLSVSNPSSVDFDGVLVNESIPADTVPGTVEIINPDGIELTVTENVGEGYFTYNIPDLGSGVTKEYTLNYDVFGLDVQTANFTEQGGEAGTQRIQFNMSTVGPTDFTDLTHNFDLSSPNQVTGTKLFVDGVENTLEPEYDFGLSDADSDAIEERVDFTVPSVEDNVSYEVRVSRGEPLNITQDTIVTNLPVTQTKTISWRKGIRFVNSNDFAVDVSRKVRVPLRATSVQVGEDFESKVFDNEGAYVPLEYTLSGNSQRAVYIRYETPSIDISEERINPSVYWVDKPTFQEVNVTFQNPYPDEVKESTANVDVLEGSDLVARANGEVIGEEENVETTYELEVENISGQSTKEVNVRYQVPVANSTYLGSQNISNGNMLDAYRIASRSPVSRQNVWYEVEDDSFSCIQAQRAYTIEGNESLDFRCGSKVDGAGDDFSTVVELPVLQPNDDFRVAVEHRAYEPVVDDVRRVAAVVGNNAAVAGTFLVFLVIGGWLSSNKLNKNTLDKLIKRLD